jgi:hypothetical protein
MRSLSTALCALSLAVLALPSRAAESYANCTGYIDSLPASITTQGTWCLRKDLTTAAASGVAINVLTNNVTIDCNDFKIGNLQAGTTTRTVGVKSEGRSNITVRNCTVRGFQAGIMLAGGAGGHWIVDNRVDLSTWAGIIVVGEGAQVRGNQVLTTGGTTDFSFAVGIKASGGVDLLDNTVSDVLPKGSNASAYGIRLDANTGTVRGNRIRTPRRTGTGESVGIWAWTWNDGLGIPAQPVLRDNNVSTSDGQVGTFGLQCVSDGYPTQTARAKDNVVDGFTTGIDGCGDGGGNDVHGSPY